MESSCRNGAPKKNCGFSINIGRMAPQCIGSGGSSTDKLLRGIISSEKITFGNSIGDSFPRSGNSSLKIWNEWWGSFQKDMLCRAKNYPSPRWLVSFQKDRLLLATCRVCGENWTIATEISSRRAVVSGQFSSLLRSTNNDSQGIS